MDIITEEMLMEAPSAPVEATAGATGTGTPLETGSPSEGQGTAKNGRVVILLRSGAAIEVPSQVPSVTAANLSVTAKAGVWCHFAEGAVLRDAEGEEVMRLASALLADAVMVGWKE